LTNNQSKQISTYQKNENTALAYHLFNYLNEITCRFYFSIRIK